ncbi:MAG: polysaccharide deacetylase family protein [Clostridiales bacterium]|nr:MAG: polysaccharide deacetylase family protein [Clostridiales bacterium]
MYLTFDEGYENGYTSKNSGCFKREKLHGGVFYHNGLRGEKNHGLIRRMIDEGHVVGNHSANHYSMPTLSNADCAKRNYKSA